MDDHEVKYIPQNGPDLLPSKCKQWIKMQGRNSSHQFSLLISILALTIALCFFTLVFTWLWGVPEKVAENEGSLKVLKDAIKDQSRSLDSVIDSINNPKSRSICFLMKAEGNCFASMPRWYFDKESKVCTQFQYSGCHGNENNFHTEESCLAACAQEISEDDHLRVLGPNGDLSGEGESCGINFESNWSKKCKPGLWCYSQDTSDGTIGTCARKDGGVQCGKRSCSDYEQCCDNRNCKQMCGVEDWTPNQQTCEISCATPMCDCRSYANMSSKETPVEKESDCFEDPETGSCRALIPRFYHDKADGTCKQFYYGGCGGNSNNFLTKDECEINCKNKDGQKPQDNQSENISICSQSQEVGTCRAAIQRWYYNIASGECEEFIWGGCDGNDNNFASKLKCELRCKDTSVFDNDKEKEPKDSDSDISVITQPKKEICLLPEEAGRCRAILERFLFNSKTGKCEPFQYGGCGGNENNFLSMEECEESCIAK